MTMYERIRYLREKLGMTQQDLADKTGYKTASAVNKIELGLRDINQHKIIAFASALGVSPSYLINGNDTPREAITAPDFTLSDSQKQLLKLLPNLNEDDIDDLLLLATSKANRHKSQDDSK